MLRDIIEIKFGTFPKIKYSLYVNSYHVYWFVTTIRKEEECINLLKQKAKSLATKIRYAKITKLENGKEIVLLKKNFYNK